MDSLFPFLAKGTLVVQVLLAIHVFRTGRPFWWFWIIFAAPFVGGLIYFFIEILPELRQSSGRGEPLVSWKPQAWVLKDLANRMEESDTVETRLAYAEGLLAAGKARAANEIAGEALTGVFRNDPTTMADVARFRLEADDAEGALQLIEQINAGGDRYLAIRVRLLQARALFGVGKLEKAEDMLRQSVGEYSGEQARYYLAKLLLLTDRREEAVAILTDIQKKFRHASPSWRRTEKRWFKEAKTLLKTRTA